MNATRSALVSTLKQTWRNKASLAVLVDYYLFDSLDRPSRLKNWPHETRYCR